MLKQIKSSVTNPTIADIYQNIESGKLVITPDFQRKFVWTHDHQEEFIYTILKGYPFPEIYVCKGEVDLKKMRTTEWVIDGQQRLTTIKKYMDGKHDKTLKKIKKFEDLTDDERGEFLSYQIVVRDIGQVDDSDIKEVFRRINLTKFKLEDVEIHNAIYDGEFIQTAKDILDNIDLSDFPVFRESEFTRMADLYFILLVMSTLEETGYFPQDKEIENYIIQYNDEYLDKNHMKALLIKTFAIIKDFQLTDDSIWYRKSSFFTMVVEIAKVEGNIPENFPRKLVELEQNIMNNKKNNNEFGEYYNYMCSGTNHRKARVVRGDIFKKHTLE
ncbi:MULTISPECIES: DUF262 domain-containing protein [Crocosphaera]|uniref:DUF262 domain-containing protein n=1 Tax=Crocosphaera TaxID=263510 RepID=UPI0025831964|nr:DUF262 domain-containing protein [Crocosphaera sp.]MCH2243798.1 DUF262 domain-containing protein [Crocosphaera sp.]